MNEPRTDVPLAPRTTLELGGPARFFLEAHTDDEIRWGLSWARERGVPVAILGGGSNLVVGDAGFEGLVLAIATRGVSTQEEAGRTLVRAAAGEPWDALVERTVGEGLAGLECLAGIPGLAGSTPIQNVGAYGQEVADTLVSVRALERETGRVVELGRADCRFSYRSSLLKREPERFVVLGVTFALRRGGAPAVRYAELERALGDRARTLSEVRRTVLELRRKKSMLLDPADPNRRSAGSFFTNPLVPGQTAAALLALHPSLPHWPEPEGRVKLAAGWLVEHAGFARGTRRGAVGVSSAHALALVHHGGGTTKELLALAAEIQAAVAARFPGVGLEREPVLWP